MSKKEVISSILKVGISLHDEGINNWALTKSQALIAIQDLKDSSIIIAGGDVLEKNGEFEAPVYNHDNWYCDQQDNESNEDYLNRSYKLAKDYITNYSSKEVEYYFTIVAIY